MLNFYKNKKVFVTGGAGFIGSFLVEELIRFGAKVTIMARSTNNLWRLKNLKKIKIVKSHLGDPELRNILKKEKPEIIFNLAAVVDISSKPPEMLAEIINPEVTNTLNILTAALGANVNRFVHVGSSKEYGILPTPFKETQRENPSFPYAVAKVVSSHLVLLMHKISPMQTCVLRFPTIYGPGQTSNLLVPNLIKACLNKTDFPMNPGLQLWDFVYVKDAVHGIICAGAEDRVQGEILNLGSDKPVKIKYVANLINEKMGSPIKINFGVMKYRSFDTPRHYLDNSKAKKILSWKTKTSIESGISETVKWYKQ